jgi:hypothetical protein
MGSCLDFSPEIDFGDYEYHFNEWNRQNMRDYKFSVIYYNRIEDGSRTKGAFVSVRNRIPESSNPPEWLARGEMSTVPEVFSFIQKEGKRIKDANAAESFRVGYNDEYHNPSSITVWSKKGIQNTEPVREWYFKLVPSVEYEQGEWDRRNMQNYQLWLEYTDFDSGSKKEAIIIVKNGIAESSDPPEWLESGEKSTIPEFFSFIKEKEERLDGSYFTVRYSHDYHYPDFIRTTDYMWYLFVKRR